MSELLFLQMHEIDGPETTCMAIKLDCVPVRHLDDEVQVTVKIVRKPKRPKFVIEVVGPVTPRES